MKVIGCTQSDCCCESFQPGQHQIRSCDRCTHSWVTHAVRKVCSQTAVCSGQVEMVQCNVVFDISSLILYGTQALPVRMKILLDRLFSVLTHTQVLNIIHTLGWTLRDYVRGYMLQDSTGKVLDCWVTMSPEEELVTLQQFLRFGETKFIVQLMVDQEQVHSESSSYIFSTDLQHRASFRGTDGTPCSSHQNLCGETDAFISLSTTSLFPASPAVSVERHPARPNKQRHSADEMMSQLAGDNEPSRGLRGRSPEQTSERSMQLNSQTIKDSTRPPKFTKHQSSHLNTPVRLVGVDSLFPDSSLSSGMRERPHGSLRKGRVSCSACAKTFYDKGTLKIHFNAVHLKIKHRCTIEGCNMMFSSLRSRNRHSANPNPRLHASQQVTRFSNQQLPTQSCSAGHRFKPFVAQLNANTLRPVLAFHRTTPPVSMAISNTDQQKHIFSSMYDTHNDSGSGGGATGTLAVPILISTANKNCSIDVINMLPKKNPRKSSTPLKFARENHHDSRSEDDEDEGAIGVKLMHNLKTLSPRQSFNSCSVSDEHHKSEILCGNNTHEQHHSKYLHKTPACAHYSCHSNSEKSNNYAEKREWTERDMRHISLSCR